MKRSIEINHIIVYSRSGKPDRVCMETELPDPRFSSAPLCFYFDVDEGSGQDYVFEHWGEAMDYGLISFEESE